MLLCPWDSPGKSTGVGCHAFLQEVFPTQDSNLGLRHCRQTLYHLSHQGSMCLHISYTLLQMLFGSFLYFFLLCAMSHSTWAQAPFSCCYFLPSFSFRHRARPSDILFLLSSNLFLGPRFGNLSISPLPLATHQGNISK